MIRLPAIPLRRLLARVPPWARPSVVVTAIGLLAMPLAYALGAWHGSRDRVDEAEMAKAIDVMRQSQIGVIPLPGGAEMTIGLGTTPGVVETGPGAPEYFWQQAEGISRQSCKALAAGFLDRPDVRTLRIGTVRFDQPALPGRDADMAETAARACDEAEPVIVSVVLAFGDQL